MRTSTASPGIARFAKVVLDQLERESGESLLPAGVDRTFNHEGDAYRCAQSLFKTVVVGIWTGPKALRTLGVVDSSAAAKRMRGTVGMLAMHWLLATSTQQKAVAAGMPADPLEAYAIGRFGVLGDCPVDNVIGAAFFWEPDFMRAKIHAGRAVMAPRDGATIYASICQEWGADHLTGFEGAERLGELVEAVVSSARPHGAPSFVGWRDQPLPDPGPARTFQLVQTMRELGFSRHCTAVQAAGMTPVQAIMSSPTGAWNARFFGWPEPFPDGEPFADARKTIEAASNRVHAPDFEVLDDDEREELVELATTARDHAVANLSPESMAAVPT